MVMSYLLISTLGSCFLSFSRSSRSVFRRSSRSARSAPLIPPARINVSYSRTLPPTNTFPSFSGSAGSRGEDLEASLFSRLRSFSRVEAPPEVGYLCSSSYQQHDHATEDGLWSMTHQFHHIRI